MKLYLTNSFGKDNNHQIFTTDIFLAHTYFIVLTGCMSAIDMVYLSQVSMTHHPVGDISTDQSQE